MSPRCDRFWVAYVWLCRLLGILTAIGLWGIGAETTYRGDMLGVYILCIAVLVTFTETIFIVNFWLTVFLSDADHPCVKCWRSLNWLDSWKKGIVYLLVSIGCFTRPEEVWIALIAGVMLTLTSLLYFIKTVKDRQDKPSKNRGYGRFNEDAADGADNGERNSIHDVNTPLPVDQSSERDDAWDV